MTNPEDHFPDTRREEQELVGRGCICKPPTCPDCGEPMLDDREGGMYGGWICAANHRGIILEWDDPDCPQHGKRGDANAGGNHVSSDVAEPRSDTENVSSKEVADLLESHLDRYGSVFEALPDAPGPSDRLEEIRERSTQWPVGHMARDDTRVLLAEIDRLRAECIEWGNIAFAKQDDALALRVTLERIRYVASKRKSEGVEQLAWDPYHAIATKALED